MKRNAGRHRTWAVVGCTVLSLVACTSNSKTSGGGSINLDEDDTIEGESLAQCGGASAAEIDQALEITAEFDLSVHELVVCGGLTVKLAQAVLEMTSKLVAGASGKPPNGFEYAGKGVYLTKDAGTEMRIWFTVGSDFRFAKTGEVIEENLFESKSFFVGLDVSGSVIAPELTFTQAGPLYELIKPGDAPMSPLKLNSEDLAKLTKRWGKLGVHGEIKVKDKRGDVEVTYDATLTGATISDVVSGKPLAFGVSSAAAARTTLMQSLTVADWDMGYNDSSASLTGTIKGELRGGPVDFDATWLYTKTGFADISVSCAE